MFNMQYDKKNLQSKYEDIINLPHHVSSTRPQMAIINRAAQFSPFAALTGYDAAIEETGRLTEEFAELDEDRKSVLNEKLQWILEHLQEKPEVVITYFRPDARKEGGAYVKVSGCVKKIDNYEHNIVMVNGERIIIAHIYEIDFMG